MPTRISRDLIPPAVLTALITVLFIDVLAGYNALYLRDLSHYYHPAKYVLREIVLGGEFPWWNPLLAAGQPLAANPEHEVFYPLTWLILLPSFELGFRLLVLLHLHIAAWSMYALLRSMRSSRAAAFLGALSFAIGGAVLSCLTLLPILFELAWLPLTCLFTRRFLLGRRRRDFALAALSFGIQVLIGEPVSLALTGFLLGAYALDLGVRQRSLRPLGGVALIAITALAVGAVTILPAVDHARDSVRAEGFSFDVVTTWSMPPARVGELFFPHLLGRQTTDGTDLYWGAGLYGKRRTPFLLGIYPGILISTMVLAGLFLRIRGAGLTIAILCTSLLLAAGDHTPLWRLLFDSGLARGVRYPEKFLLMGIFAATVFAARTLDAFLRGDERTRRTVLRVAGTLAALTALAAILTLTPLHAPVFERVWHPRPSLLKEMLASSRLSWIVSALTVSLLVVLVRNAGTSSPRAWVTLATVLVLLDLGLVLPEIAPRVPSTYFREPPRLARTLPGNRDAWRLMHVVEWQNDDIAFRPFTTGPDLYWVRRNALRPMMPARWGIRTVMEVDFDATALQPTTDFVGLAWWLAHVREDWAAVIAPMANARFLGSYDDPERALRQAGNDRRSMQPVRIDPLGEHPRYFFAERIEPFRDLRDLAGTLATVRSSRGTAYVEKRFAAALAPAPLAAGAGRAFPVARGSVLSVRETANTARLEVETAGRAFLVMSVTPHKYWRVTVDGREAKPIVTNVGFQGLPLHTAGRHVVEMRYRNPLLLGGGAVSLVTALVLVLLTMRSAGPRTPTD